MRFSDWTVLCDFLGSEFGIEVDLNGVLFLVGMRERGLLFGQYTREEKMNLINLGSCILYQEMGLTEMTGTGTDGWPVFRQKSLAPVVPEPRKQKILQDCALRYFTRIYAGMPDSGREGNPDRKNEHGQESGEDHQTT